ncbi:MAG TPA: ISNCY family transposase [Patescibacteria group bacterium]
MAFITMSHQELDRYQIIQRLLRKEIENSQAAELLNLSIRQVKRLKKKVKLFGPKALAHGNRGKQSNHRLSDSKRNKIINVVKNRYPDFGPTLACEKLTELHSISHDVKTIRQIMIDEKLWKPKLKKHSEHREWRQRRECFGEMQQFDGSYHPWFEDRAPECCLLASIDDATGEITEAEFGQHETVFEVFSFWQGHLLTNGKPRSIYLDKFSTYKMNPRFAQTNHELKTQFERALKELHIEPITAHSPEAKGRVERLFGVLQDRLVKELRLHDISTIPEANRFLKRKFLPWFNKKFAKPAANSTNLHQILTIKEQQQLPAIFSKQYTRIVQNDFTISFNNQWYQLTKDQPVTICKQDQVIVEQRLDGTIKIRLRGKYLSCHIIPKRIPNRERPWVLAAVANH